MEANRDIIHFVKGMAMHDIAKPLFLNGSKHSLAGFTVMSTFSNYPDEALAILFHHDMAKNLKLLFGLDAVSSDGFGEKTARGASSIYLLADSKNLRQLSDQAPTAC